MLIGDYFDGIARLIHEHETAGFVVPKNVGQDLLPVEEVTLAAVLREIVGQNLGP